MTEKQQIEEENGANDEGSINALYTSYTCIFSKLRRNPNPSILIPDDNTQDLVEDEHQFGRIKDWINSYHLDTVELTDVLSNFPDISVVRFFFRCSTVSLRR